MVGETVQLVAVVKNASNQAVTWSSSAEAIATVSESGLVTAVAPGIAVITATSVADPTKKAAASIRVNAPPPLVLTLTPESAEIKPGETLQLVATVSDGSAVTFSSSAENVATVDESGLVTGVAPGTAVITAAAVADPTVRKTAAITVVAPVEPTVQIKSITQGDLTTPVNPNNVSGQMAITLNVDAPAGSGVSAVQLFIDDVLAGEQTFTAADGGDVEAQAAEIVFIVDTGNYDNETGKPAWLNGARTVSAVLAGQDGAVRASTSQQLTFNNPDGFHAIVEIKKDGEVVTATDANALTWISGDVIVTLLPVMYSGREIASVTAGFNGAQQTATSAPFQVTFAANAGAPGTGANAVIGGAPGARPVVIASLTTQGQPGPAGFGTFRNASDPSLNVVRLDNRPPTIASFTLRTQADAVDCCVDGWVGPDYDFTDQTGALTGVDDAGVGRVTDITYYAALASVAATPNQVVAIGDVITTGDDLQETEFNNIYRVAVYLCDALLNCAAYELDTLIGVDKTAPPDLQFDAGTVADEAINPPASSQFIIDPIADDYASGYGPNSLLASLVFNFGEACVVGTGASCAPRPLGDVKAYTAYAPSWPDYAEGYYTFTALARDKAGNRTNPITRTVLMDNTPPVAGT